MLNRPTFGGHIKMRGVFVCEAVPRSSGGWEPQLSYAFDNQTLINHWVPNLAITRGVGNHDLRNKLIINHLKATTYQTYCFVLKIDTAGGMDRQAKRLAGRVPCEVTFIFRKPRKAKVPRNHRNRIASFFFFSAN